MLVQHELQNAYIGEYIPPREPWSNTLLYMPLDSDLRDLSSYNRTASITNGTISYHTVWGVECAHPTFTGRINIPMTDFNNLAYTESIWVYAIWNTTWKYIFGNKNSSWSYIDVTFVTDNSGGNKRANYFGGDHISNTVYTTWEWKLITVTRSWSTVKMYQNGVQFYTYSYSNAYAFASIDLFSRSDYGQQRPWYAADFIVEKVCWTDDEVLNYYNSTKDKYGVSYAYEYYFRGKTTATVTNDWWSTFSDVRSWSVDSNWVHIVWYPWNLVKTIWNSYFQDAKKITLESHFNIQTYATNYYVTATSGSSSVISNSWCNIDSRQSFRKLIFNGTNKAQANASIPYWEYDSKVVLDLVNKTAILSLSWFADTTASLTDADISNVKNNVTDLLIWFYNDSNSNTASYVRNVNLIIDY